MLMAEVVSENTNAKLCAVPLPELGVTEHADGGPVLGAVMVSPELVVCTSEPLVPVTVAVNVPVDPPVVVLTVKVLEPEPGNEVGLKLPVTPDGSPDTPKLTVPLKPLMAVAVTV